MSVEYSEVGIETVCGECRIDAIRLYGAIALKASRGIILSMLGIEAHTSQFEVYAAAYVARSLRIAVESGIEAYALQVSALHVRRYGVHLVGAGIEYLHAVDGC